MTLFELFNRLFADDRRDSPYIMCKHAHHWHRRGRKQLVECVPGTHEQFLRDFLQTAPNAGDTAENRRLLLIGPPGSGKSTYVRNQLIEFQKLSKVNSLTVDFKGLNDSNVDEENVEMRTGYYLRISLGLSSCHLSVKIDPKLKLVDMWHWASKNARVFHDSEKLNQHLNTVITRIQCVISGSLYLGEKKAETMRFLSYEQDNLERSLGGRDRIWYEVMQILFKRQRHLGVRLLDPRDAVVLDNVDGLPRTLQLDAINIAGALSEVLECKVIVPLRPQTWRNINVEAGIHIVDHYCPDVSEVVLSRILWAQTDPSIKLTQDNNDALDFLKDCLESNKVFAKMVLTAFSHNVRLALFSLSNLAENEILRTHKLEKLTIHQLANAFFLGNSGELDRDRVEDLYLVGLKRDGCRLIKPRILDYLMRLSEGLASRNDIVLHMARFGQNRLDVDQAISELTGHLRPLLWSNHDNHGSLDEIFGITEVGIRYMNDFFGELFYERVTISEGRNKTSDHVREKFHEIVSPVQVLARHNDLTKEDLEGLLHAISSDENGETFVKSKCPFDTMLCVTHWRRLRLGLQRVKSSYGGEISFDADREQFLRKVYEVIVSEKRLPNDILLSTAWHGTSRRLLSGK